MDFSKHDSALNFVIFEGLRFKHHEFISKLNAIKKRSPGGAFSPAGFGGRIGVKSADCGIEGVEIQR